MKKIDLKKMIVDNLIMMFISFAVYIGTAYIMFEKILVNFKPLWFALFFVSFGVFMYNLIVIIKVDNIGYHVKRDLKDLSNDEFYISKNKNNKK